MHKKPIALVISTILAAGLAGCNSVTDNTATPSTPVANQSQTQSMANVTFSTAFPRAGEAQAAVIDENATSILIQIYATEVNNWIDYFSQQGDYEGYGGYYEESLVEEFYLDATSPSQSVSLIPGPYRIVASQFDATGLESGIPMSGAVTLGELVSGENAVVLNMLHGTWTFKDEANADTPLELQLLGRTDLTDADPNTDGQQTVDWDPSTPDTVESVADVLGLNGTNIKGLHLIGLTSALFDGYGGYAESYGSAQYAALSPWEAIGYGYYSLLRQDDGAGGEVVVDPSIPLYGELCNNTYDSCTTIEAGGLGLVLHEFDGVTGTNTAQVDLGTIHITSGIYDPDSEAWNEFGAGLFTVARYEMQSLIDGGFDGNSDWPGEPSDDGSNIVYTPPAEESSYQWQAFYYDTDSGSYQAINLANLSLYSETFSHTNSESSIFEQVDETVATDGTTIVGTIIEYMDVEVTQTPDPYGGGGYSGAAAPPYNGPAPASSAALNPDTKIAAIKRALALDEIAIGAGLKAQSANANGSNCRTLNISETEINANYGWDEENSQWVAGEYNDTYSWNGTEVTGEDWNENGTVERFEAGVIKNNSYWQEWDAVNLVYIDQGDDLDGDGTPEWIENVGARQRDSSSVVEACVHPFILKGGQLTYVTDTTINVASE